MCSRRQHAIRQRAAAHHTTPNIRGRPATATEKATAVGKEEGAADSTEAEMTPEEQAAALRAAYEARVAAEREAKGR